MLAIAGCVGDPPDKAQAIVDKAIEAHGSQHLNNARVSFTFRNIEYSMSRNPAEFVYTRSFEDSLGHIKDVLVNSREFTRLRDGDTVQLSEEWQRRYSSSVNAVLYFMQLPYPLNDPAVNKQYAGETLISGEPYHVVKVTFDTEGGGEDYEDEYMYWIHRDDYTVDYLAYNYQTEGGGVRFRKAYNRTQKGGVLFQDYINYAVKTETPLIAIPQLYENGALRELSRIENEDIRVDQINY